MLHPKFQMADQIIRAIVTQPQMASVTLLSQRMTLAVAGCDIRRILGTRSVLLYSIQSVVEFHSDIRMHRTLTEIPCKGHLPPLVSNSAWDGVSFMQVFEAIARANGVNPIDRFAIDQNTVEIEIRQGLGRIMSNAYIEVASAVCLRNGVTPIVHDARHSH